MQSPERLNRIEYRVGTTFERQQADRCELLTVSVGGENMDVLGTLRKALCGQLGVSTLRLSIRVTGTHPASDTRAP
jgi:hypothetical protein